jgi:hypothetical protein
LTRREGVTTLAAVNLPRALLRTVGLGLPALFAAACSGPPVPSPIGGEPVCTDFEVGVGHATKMRGGLRFPVTLSVKQGKTVVGHATLRGLRSEKDKPASISLPDGNEEYTVEWAQCENETAPRPVTTEHAKKGAPDRGETAHYECGNATVYKTDKLVTKKGDISTHALTVPAPPKPACWVGDVAAKPASSGSAEAPPAAPPSASASAPPPSSAAPSASAPPPASSK